MCNLEKYSISDCKVTNFQSITEIFLEFFSKNDDFRCSLTTFLYLCTTKKGKMI